MQGITETHRVMILGGGKIGRTLAKELPSDSINVRLVDYNRLKAGQISHNIDESMILHGDGTDIEFLKSENIQDIDSFIAVTENEKTNLVAGLLAKHLGANKVLSTYLQQNISIHSRDWSWWLLVKIYLLLMLF